MATITYIDNNSTPSNARYKQYKISVVNTSADVATATSLVGLNPTTLKIDKAFVDSVAIGGIAANAGKVPALNANGMLDNTFIDVTLLKEVSSTVAFEALTLGKMVNIYQTGSGARVRLADNSASNQFLARGFVVANYAAGATAVVYSEGTINGLSGLTSGAAYYLGTAGAITAVKPTGAGVIVQVVGYALNETTFTFNIDEGLELA